MPSLSPRAFILRMFYRDAKATGIVVNPIESFFVCASTVVGFFVSFLLRTFMIAIILIPFFGLMHHARREGGGVVSDLSEMLEWMYLRCGDELCLQF